MGSQVKRSSTGLFKPSLIAIAVAQALFGMQAQAATITVSNTSDSGPGSFRQAVLDAAPGDIVTFAAGLSGQTISLTNIVVVDKNLTIDGDLDNDGTPDITLTAPSQPFILAHTNSSSLFDGLALSNSDTAVYSVPSNYNGATPSNTSLELRNCTISGNSSSHYGAVINSSDSGLSADLTINSSTISGNQAYDGIVLNRANPGTTANITINNSTITGNLSQYGAISNIAQGAGASASTTINSSTISGNNSYAGSVLNVAGLMAVGNVSINSSTVTGTNAFVGGVALNFGAGGTANLNIVDSTLSSNSAVYGGGVFNVSKYAASQMGTANATISGSTLVDNSALYGSSLINTGFASNASMTVVNSTITGNHIPAIINGPTQRAGGSAYYSSILNGGKYDGGPGEAPTLSRIPQAAKDRFATRFPDASFTAPLHQRSPLTTILNITNSTISGNVGTHSLANLYATTNLANTIIANTLGGVDCYGTLAVNSANLISDGTCSPAHSGDPMLGALADNGGTTQTMMPADTSPVRDAGDNSYAQLFSLDFDQRGIGYARITNGTVDIGSVEWGSAPPPPAQLGNRPIPVFGFIGQLLLGGLLAALGALGLRRRRS